MSHGRRGNHSIPGLKLQELPQQINGLAVKPGGVQTERLGLVDVEIGVRKLRVLGYPWPSSFGGGAENLQDKRQYMQAYNGSLV